MTGLTLNQANDGRSAAQLLQEVLLFNDARKHSICRELKINETDFNDLQHLTFGKGDWPGFR